MIKIEKSLSGRKTHLLQHLRERAQESLEVIARTYGSTQYKLRARAMNRAVIETRNNIVKALLKKSSTNGWTSEEILKCVLMITYASYVVMIESRNEIWPYEYMTFSRRMGELWEPFCKSCFDYPLRELIPFVPPLFSEVKNSLTTEIEDYIDTLNITAKQKKQLKEYYAKVWSFVTSGSIKLELDLHFEQAGEKFVVDFKSGFGSNEKGNTNRLLLVASVYGNLEDNYRCLLLVRAEEDRNNNYFQTLKNSGIWEAHCGANAYDKITEHSGFDIGNWIAKNIDWKHDFVPETIQHFEKKGLTQYLKW